MRWTSHFPRRRVAGISYFPVRYFTRGLRVRISCRGQIERSGGVFERRQSKKRKLARCVRIAHPTRYMYSIAPRYSLKTHKLLVDFRMHIILLKCIGISPISRAIGIRLSFAYFLAGDNASSSLHAYIFPLKWFCPKIFSSMYQ